MGNTDSAKKKKEIKSVPQQSGQESEGKLLIDTKKVLLLHNSDSAQLQVVRNFRDALIGKTEGTVHVTDFVNIADENKIPKSLEWLDDSNNIVLICLTSEAVEQFQKIVQEKRFADENGRLHPKVFTISFGEKVTSKWPPKGLKKGSSDLRDFNFGFSDLETIRPHDFERSPRLNSLIAAMKLTR